MTVQEYKSIVAKANVDAKDKHYDSLVYKAFLMGATKFMMNAKELRREVIETERQKNGYYDNLEEIRSEIAWGFYN